MCRSFTFTRWPLAIAIVAVLCILAPSTAFAQAGCQASASIPIFPSAGGSCATGLLPGQTLDSVITLTNTSSTTPLPGVPVAAVWQGTITVTYPVGDTFVPVGATGCVVNDPGVLSCTAVANVVTITSTAGGVALAAAASNFPIATLRTVVGGPALPGCTPVGISAATPFAAGITTNDVACNPQVVGGAQGAANYREVQCLLPTDCPAGTECSTPTCVDNACGTAPAPATTHCGAADTECATHSCDGAGTCATNNTAATTHCGAADTECQTHSCDGAGTCATNNTASTTHCGAADTECQTHSCDGAGTCATNNTAATTHCGAADTACETHSCDGSGTCATSFQPATTTCNADLCQSCPGDSGVCPTTNNCVEEACRTPGYWAQHAGQEKTCATNQTSLVIQSVGSIEVCGQTINPFLGAGNTGVDHQTSPIEALCMPNGGDFRSQVVFQLTAAILNCVANGHLADCSNDPLFGAVVAACDTAEVCAPTTKDNKAAQAACVSALDCLNNGGHPGLDGTGKFICAFGTCSDNGAPCNGSNLTACANPATATCNAAPNCHTLNFTGFPDSCAGSQDACKAASKNSCTIFGGCSFNP